MRKLASIVRIGETYPIEDSDRLSVAIPEVKAWRIVTARDVFTELPTVDAILKFAEGKTASGHEREGVVFKEEGTHHPRSFKAVSNAYLLKQK